MASAAVALGDSADINGASAAKRTSEVAIFELYEQSSNADRSEALTFVDKIFCVPAGGAGFVKIFAHQVLYGDSAVKMQFEAIEHTDHEFEAGQSKILIEFLINLRRPGAGVYEVCGVAEKPAVGVCELEPSAVGCKRYEEGLCGGLC